MHDTSTSSVQVATAEHSKQQALLGLKALLRTSGMATHISTLSTHPPPA